jgi:hypothetical protein
MQFTLKNHFILFYFIMYLIQNVQNIPSIFYLDCNFKYNIFIKLFLIFDNKMNFTHENR